MAARFLKILGWLIALFILWRAFGHVDVDAAFAILRSVGPSAWLIPLPFLLSLSLDTWGWQQIFRRLDVHTRFRPLFRIRMATEAVLLGLMGGVVMSEGMTPYLLKRSFGNNGAQAAAAMLSRKILLIFTQGFYIAVGCLLGGLYLYRTWGDDALWLIGALLVIALFMSLGTWFLARHFAEARFVAFLHRGLAKIPIPRLRRGLETRRDGFLATDRDLHKVLAAFPNRVWGTVAAYFFVWLSEAFETYLLLRLLGADVPFLAVWAFEPALSLLRHLVFFIPAGLGVQDAGYVTFIRLLGVEDAVAMGAAFSLLKRGKELMWVLLGLAVFGFLSRRVTGEGANIPREQS